MDERIRLFSAAICERQWTQLGGTKTAGGPGEDVGFCEEETGWDGHGRIDIVVLSDQIPLCLPVFFRTNCWLTPISSSFRCILDLILGLFSVRRMHWHKSVKARGIYNPQSVRLLMSGCVERKGLKLNGGWLISQMRSIIYSLTPLVSIRRSSKTFPHPLPPPAVGPFLFPFTNFLLLRRRTLGEASSRSWFLSFRSH